MIKLIIFDYDGVIVDSFPTYQDVFKIICNKFGKSCPDNLEEFKNLYGHSSSECFYRLGFSEEEEKKAKILFKAEIFKIDQKPFAGIIELIKEFHKTYKLALISSSYTDEVKRSLDHLGILNLFDMIVAKDSLAVHFEKSEPIKKVMNNFELSSKEVLMIGDRNIDFIEGSLAGLNNILLVEYGWGYDLKVIFQEGWQLN